MDSEYLREHLGTCLTDCLVEVCEKRPKDPIEYMAQWLYKYLDNQNFAKEERMKALALEKEIQDFEQEKVMNEKLKAEQIEIAADEKRKRETAESASKEEAKPEEKDPAQSPSLPTVVEKEKPASSEGEKNKSDEEKKDDEKSAEVASEELAPPATEAAEEGVTEATEGGGEEQ